MIELRNVTKQFRAVTAVDDVSLSVPAGEIFALLGPNGAGKSTTVKMLTTLLAPTRGVVAVNGFDTTRQSHLARRSFGVVFQDPSLDGELTVWENMELHAVLYDVPRAERRARMERLLGMVELLERRSTQAKTLSGGMKRRLEIARGLLHEPQVLFLDEPTLGLDPQTRVQLWTHVRELNRTRGTTVLVTTHYMEEAERNAQRIAIMDRGKIVALGTAEELRHKTNGATLEEAFLAITGRGVREEAADPRALVRAMIRNQSARA